MREEVDFEYPALGDLPFPLAGSGAIPPGPARAPVPAGATNQ